MPKKMLKLLLFLLVLTLLLSLTPSLFAQDEDDIFSRYQLDARDKAILAQPAICFVSTLYFASVLDPNFDTFSEPYVYGPIMGTGFTVNPITGHIVTAAHIIEYDNEIIKELILDEYIWQTYPDEYWDLTEEDWYYIYDNYLVKGEYGPEPDREIWVQYNTGSVDIPERPDDSYLKAELIDVSPWEERDIAILQVQPPANNALTGIIIGDSGRVEIQDKLTIIGYPYPADISMESLMTPTVSSGVISAKKRLDGAEIFQIDGAAYEGNSGGPVLNEKGEVIGMLTMGTADYINFLRPGSEILDMLNKNVITNEIGNVGETFAKGLVLYRMNHFSESIKFFDEVLDASQGHLLAQDYKGNAQKGIDRGEDIPFQEQAATEIDEPIDDFIPMETVDPEVQFQKDVQEAMEKIKGSGESDTRIGSGLSNTAIILIIAGGVLLFIIIIVVVIIVIIFAKKKGAASKKTDQSQIRTPEPPVPAKEPEDKTEPPTVPPPVQGLNDKTEPKTKFCSNCGNQIEEGEGFCANCGNKL